MKFKKTILFLLTIVVLGQTIKVLSMDNEEKQEQHSLTITPFDAQSESEIIQQLIKSNYQGYCILGCRYYKQTNKGAFEPMSAQELRALGIQTHERLTQAALNNPGKTAGITGLFGALFVQSTTGTKPSNSLFSGLLTSTAIYFGLDAWNKYWYPQGEMNSDKQKEESEQDENFLLDCNKNEKIEENTEIFQKIESNKNFSSKRKNKQQFIKPLKELSTEITQLKQDQNGGFMILKSILQADFNKIIDQKQSLEKICVEITLSKPEVYKLLNNNYPYLKEAIDNFYDILEGKNFTESDVISGMETFCAIVCIDAFDIPEVKKKSNLLRLNNNNLNNSLLQELKKRKYTK